MTATATVIVPTYKGGARLRRLLDSVAPAPVVVVDNGSPDDLSAWVERDFPTARVLRLERNEGFSRAVNLAARSVSSDVIVLLNDDCVCSPGFVARIVEGIDSAAGTTMAAAVMVERHDASTIDSGGIELDDTLLVFDYLNGSKVEALAGALPPIGPSGAAAAFDRVAFLEVGGFDEALFAYWEDVDLALRMRLAGATCSLVADARAVHEHSATLGSGSAHKNYLTGYGRGYVLRKWSVFGGRRTLRIVLGDGLVCAGQAVVDRNVAGLRGRFAGWRGAGRGERFPYPREVVAPGRRTLTAELRRRHARRRRLEHHNADG